MRRVTGEQAASIEECHAIRKLLDLGSLISPHDPVMERLLPHLETLRKRGVRPLESLGADFDPHYHNAVAHEPANGRREGEIIEEFRRGYMLGDRLLRPAMVKVAKG